jgi:hypothetical protein
MRSEFEHCLLLLLFYFDVVLPASLPTLPHPGPLAWELDILLTFFGDFTYIFPVITTYTAGTVCSAVRSIITAAPSKSGLLGNYALPIQASNMRCNINGE